MDTNRNGASTSPGGSRQEVVLLLSAILIVGLLLRVWGLSSFAFEQDELYTLRDATSLPKGTYFRPVYYLLQHVLLEWLPVSHFYLRLPAFVFGVAGVWVTWRLARTVFGATAGLVAGLLVAVSPWHLYASGFARYWTLVYLLAAAAFLFLWRGFQKDELRSYLSATAAILLGALTHPTVIFPLVGVIAAMYLVTGEGRIRFGKPTTNCLLGLILPLGGVFGAAFLALLVTDNVEALRPAYGRGWEASVRLIPAVVQWGGPAVFAAAALGAMGLVALRDAGDRRWGLGALAGAATSLGGLFAASLAADVYADYALSLLPMVFVSAGGVIQRVSERVSLWGGWVATGAALTLVFATLPETVSHLNGGTRFDYRPAFAFIRSEAPAAPVFGWPIVLQRWYAPDLSHQELSHDPAQLEAAVSQHRGIWVVSSHRRRGIVAGAGALEQWLGEHCSRRHVFERPRLDYRTYRVEVHWCE